MDRTALSESELSKHRCIGFIGLGHMGQPMAARFLSPQSPYTLWVYDVVPEAAHPLVQQGAHSAPSVQHIAEHCDVVFLMLQTGDQVSQICLGETGLFRHAPPDLLIIDSSSIDIQTTRRLSDEAQSHGIEMLDAPVSGGVVGATAGTLTVMVGGSASGFERAQPYLEKIGKNIMYTGAAGNGQASKMANNMVLAISMIATSEAFLLGKKLGVDPNVLFEVMSKSSGQNWALTQYCPYPGILEQVPSSKGYKPGFTAKMMLKDLKLAQTAARSVDIATPMGSLAESLYTLFVHTAAEQPEKDFSGIIDFLS
jgi:3-hydroxyisobutyrate dehydrogenase